MKLNTISVFFIFIILFTTLGLEGCGQVNQYDHSPYHLIHIEEEAHLTEEATSPYCDFSIDYSCLNEEGDSVAKLINNIIHREFLGEEYAFLTPEAAIDSFKNVYLRDYRQEVGKLYLTDKAQASTKEEIPAWYNRTYSLVTFVEEGHNGTINASANTFVDTGAAHPNQWSHWLNFEFETGKLLSKEDVFLSSAKTEIEQTLLNKLILQQAKLYPDETISTLKDIQKKGFLQMTNIYIPDNFLLGKEAVLFLFNRYDIAPYSAGEIVIEVPYEEIGPYLKN